jgi:uncharacterized protein with PIN domain
MNKEIDIKNEEYFRSKGNENGAYDMARITIELPISEWRAIKSKMYGDESVSHQRRLSDFKKEKDIKCPNPNCKDGIILLRERTDETRVDEKPVKYKEVFYKCDRCGEEFDTEFLIKENKRRIEMNKNKKIS